MPLPIIPFFYILYYYVLLAPQPENEAAAIIAETISYVLGEGAMTRRNDKKL